MASGQPSNFPLCFMTIEPVFKIPATCNRNLTFQRQAGFQASVSVANWGRAGLHLERARVFDACDQRTF